MKRGDKPSQQNKGEVNDCRDRKAASMKKLKVYEVDGRWYRRKIGGYGCEGCAAIEDDDICISLPPCVTEEGEGFRPYIWVEVGADEARELQDTKKPRNGC